MGTVRSPFKAKAMQMRLRGMSLNEIQKALNLPSKGTLSLWFKELKLSPEAVARLHQKKLVASKHNLRNFNQTRSRKIKGENEKEYEKGRKQISHISRRELMLIGIALYWGEGTKLVPPNHSPSLAFTNSDSNMVALYLKFLREILLVPDIRIRGGIHLYSTTNIEGARKHWSKVTKLPFDRFYVITVTSGASGRKRVLQRLPYGTLVIRVNDRKLFFRMRGMMAVCFHNYNTRCYNTRVNRTTAIALLVILLAAGGWYVISQAGTDTSPQEGATSNQSENLQAGWVYSQPNAQGIQFAYPQALGTNYVSAHDWPPSVELVGGGFECAIGEMKAEGSPMTKVEQRVIGGGTYCIATFSEGAAGSVYKTYEYSVAQSSDFSARVVFTLQFPQCGNYGEAEEQVCEREQAALNIDAIADRIASSIRML